MSSQPPTLTYLLNIRDDSDPLNISLGNTDLRDTHTHSTNISYTHNNRKIQGNFLANVNFNYIKNAIAMGLTYDRTTGVRTYRPDNVNGNYTLDGNINYGRALDKKQRWNFYTSTGASYNHNVDFVGVGDATQSLRSVVNNLYLNEMLKIDYRFGSKFSIGAKAVGNWSRATSERDDFHTINAGDFNYGLIGQVELPWKMQLSTDLTMYMVLTS